MSSCSYHVGTLPCSHCQAKALCLRCSLRKDLCFDKLAFSVFSFDGFSAFWLFALKLGLTDLELDRRSRHGLGHRLKRELYQDLDVNCTDYDLDLNVNCKDQDLDLNCKDYDLDLNVNCED